jgi:hypothetical protein
MTEVTPVANNRARSDVKFLEYASHGVVPVLQRAEPYRESVREGQAALLFDGVEELLTHLNRLVDDYRYRVPLGIAARDFVCRRRTYAQSAADRLECYRSLHRKRSTAVADVSARKRFEAWTTLAGAVCRGRHLVLLPTGFETVLRQGLYALEKGHTGEAGKYFRMAQSICPNSYLPYLYLSGCAPAGSREAHGWASQALSRNPESQLAQMILSESASASET